MAFTPNANLIDKRIAAASHAGTSFDPEKRAEQEINEFVETVREVYEKLKPYAKSEAQRLTLDSEMARFQTNYASKYNDLLASHSRIVSPMIAGPSKFPVASMQKKNRAYDNKFEDTMQWKSKVINSIKGKLKDMATEEAGGEAAVLQNKIDSAKHSQEVMKQANAIIRKKISDAEKFDQIKNLGFKDETVREILKPDFMGRIGFPQYALQNNLQNIKRMEERIVELGRREATPARDLEFEGGTIVIDKDDDRVKILFDAIPSESMRTKLKGEGWRWSPYNKAWQRKFTENALWSAKRITGAKDDIPEVKKELDKGKTVEVPETVLKEELKPAPKIEPLLLYPAQEHVPELSRHITKLERGETIELPGSELKLLMAPAEAAIEARTAVARRPRGKGKGRKVCVPPVHVKAHCRKGCTIKVDSYTRPCPVRRR